MQIVKRLQLGFGIRFGEFDITERIEFVLRLNLRLYLRRPGLSENRLSVIEGAAAAYLAESRIVLEMRLLSVVVPEQSGLCGMVNRVENRTLVYETHLDF